MPISARVPAELTPAADPLIRRSKGRLASDEAQAAGRIADYLGEADRAPVGELMRACDLTPQVIGALVRCGALRLHTQTPAPGRCERCGEREEQAALCGSCRALLGGQAAPAALGPRGPRPPAAVAGHPDRAGARTTGGMRTARSSWRSRPR